MDTLTKQVPNAIEWVLAPLEQAVPGDIRQNLTFLREDLLDEGETPKASPDAYKLGAQISNPRWTLWKSAASPSRSPVSAPSRPRRAPG